MNWRFTIIDRYQFETPVEEPIGWADIQFKLSRDASMHGMFYDYTLNSFEFIGTGRDIIKEEHERYGIEGIMYLKIEYECNGGYEVWSSGRIVFTNWDELQSSLCSVKVSIENITEIQTLKNRIDQKIDITKLKSFDTVTDIAAYSKAPFTISLPSKSIQLKSRAENTEQIISENFTENAEWEPNTVSGGDLRQMRAQFIPGFNTTISADIATTIFFSQVQMINGGNPDVPATGLSPIIDMQDLSEALKCVTGDVLVNYRWKGAVSVSGGPLSGGSVKCIKLPAGLDPDNPSNYEVLASDSVSFSGFDVSQSISTTLLAGDKIWVYLYIFPDFSEDYTDFTITQETETFFETTLNSLCDPSDADVFMINEAVSRIIENISDNKLKLYSEYLGRTDSEPYSFTADGPGSLACITNGLKIRRVNNADGTKPSCFISLKDAFESLQAIHNVGMGIQKLDEDGSLDFDLTKDNLFLDGPEFIVRIENWKWFYKNEVIHTCADVDKINVRENLGRYISKFITGYEKWEAEQYNGLDEFLTKREYATLLTQVSNAVTKTAKMIASGYAWEVTRRQDATSKDWRFDNDIFIACVQRAEDVLQVEINNIISAANIIDPETVYNFRISPLRNLMRWADYILASYRNADTSSLLKFTSGEGNLLATGELSGSFAKLENAPLSENQNITQLNFADVENATPVWFLNEVRFSYPLSLEDFNKLINYPYGKIAFTRNNKIGYGWISEISFKPNEGMAEFILIPSIENGSSSILNNFIITEDGQVIITETGFGLITE
ncbi:MAG TPA: hypothetical protein PL045_03315 [Chitinophagaceae bacterium]|nr:hypothetical protein [Chitinophagaceae bacterium]